jgi:hypothetical protein
MFVVFRSVQVAQDPVRDREETIAGDGHQAGIRILVALHRSLDEKSIHSASLIVRLG